MNSLNVKYEKAKLIEEFLEKIRKELPLRIRSNKEELKNIEEELEDHIWEMAFDISEKEEPSLNELEIAIKRMGDPGVIAKQFETKIESPFYISEKLFPLFVKKTKNLIIFSTTMLLFGSLFFLFFRYESINPIYLTLSNPLFILFLFLNFLFYRFLYFIYLSKEGYFPEDLKHKINLNRAKDMSLKDLKVPINKRKLRIFGIILFVSGLILSLFTDSYGVFPFHWLLPTNLFFQLGSQNNHIIAIADIIFLSGIILLIRSAIKKEQILLHRILKFMNLNSILYTIGILSSQLYFGTPNLVIMFWNIPIIGVILGLLILFAYNGFIVIVLNQRVLRYKKKKTILKRFSEKHQNQEKKIDFKNSEGNTKRSTQKTKLSNRMEEEDFTSRLNDYLQELKLELPLWLSQTEIDKILIDLEEHILQKVKESSNGKKLSLSDLNKAINEVGDPKSIAKKYKERSKPKLYIPSQKFPLFKNLTKFMLFTIIYLGILNFQYQRVLYRPRDLLTIPRVITKISTLYVLFQILFILITLVFIIASMKNIDLHPMNEIFLNLKDLDKKVTYKPWLILSGILAFLLGFFLVIYEPLDVYYSSRVMIGAITTIYGVNQFIRLLLNDSHHILSLFIIIINLAMSLIAFITLGAAQFKLFWSSNIATSISQNIAFPLLILGTVYELIKLVNFEGLSIEYYKIVKKLYLHSLKLIRS